MANVPVLSYGKEQIHHSFCRSPYEIVPNEGLKRRINNKKFLFYSISIVFCLILDLKKKDFGVFLRI